MTDDKEKAREVCEYEIDELTRQASQTREEDDRLVGTEHTATIE